ncbi:MAG: FkbM family methyltransferase [Acidobacteria bacterium]|nr:FkbM family methyltransferase [Acidobacteriota bacterium]
MRSSHPGGLTRDHVVWAYRLLLDRDPESEDVIGPKLAGSANTAELRHHLITSSEFRRKNPDFAQTNERTVVIKEIAAGVRLFLDLSDHVIGLNILRGRYEQDEIALVASLLKPGDRAIDVGAHIGFFTMQMAAMVGEEGRVYAFEPLDANAELLERSLVENRFDRRVVLHRAAAARATGVATLTFPAETLNSGGAYLLRDGAAPLTGNQTRTVPALALDDLRIDRPVRLIKMDVEGAEPLVVQGAARLIREDRPTILSELHPVQLDRASAATPDAFLAQMRALGYIAHAVERGRIGPPIDRAPAETMVGVVMIWES